MASTVKMRFHAVSAVLAGLALRTAFILKFPVSDTGDSPFYIDLAWNWLKHGVYGLTVNGGVAPVDMRVPGYPAFLAAIFAAAGESERAVMFAQAVLELLTCCAIALIAARLAPRFARRRTAIAALWLAALCPFTANYTAVVLAETLAIFLTSVAILMLVQTELGANSSHQEVSGANGGLSPWFLAGIVAGFGTLVRPETPLLLLAAGLVLLARWWKPVNWPRLMRATALMSIGLVLPLAPWAARNWRTLHEIQFLAPRYGQLPGELAPRGFEAWTHTWLWRFRDVFAVDWKLDGARIDMADLPPAAFDSPAQRTEVAKLLASYNQTLTLTSDEDRGFGEIARERTALHPMRTWVKIPLLRSLALWFAPRVELLPYTGQLFPISRQWDQDREDFSVTAVLVLVNAAYLGLALLGAWTAWKISPLRPAVAFLIVFVVIRTAFIGWFAETPEPRYVLECFPAITVLAAFAFARGFRPPQLARDESSVDRFAGSVPSRGFPASP